VFDKRATEPERIDTGDYTPEEYQTFLREIAFINRHFGDGRALKKTLLREIEERDLRSFSVLDVGCGSGELLRMIAAYADSSDRRATLVGIDLNPLSSSTTHTESVDFPAISSVQGDAFQLPFADDTFDYAISSLFFHHLADDQIPIVLHEMSRVAHRGIVVIDLHRDVVPFVGYKILCAAFRISPLVREDGSLSIRKGFKAAELSAIAGDAGFETHAVEQVGPGRVVLVVES
jgi:ubiquinone/menaquinone biosynthesis C-methylase UbiE